LTENNTRVVKSVPAHFEGEQRKRFLARIDDPERLELSLADHS